MSTITTRTRSRLRRLQKLHLAAAVKQEESYISSFTIENDEFVEEDDIIKQITFDKCSQSVLSITNFDEPLQIQHQYPIPKLGEHDILIENKAVGLNPIDWKGKKYQFGIYHFPWINGRESSGIVVKTGSNVKSHEFSPGDKVIVSSTSYRDNRTSTFQQYTAIDSRLVWKLPPKFSFEDGATIGVGLVTAGIIFYNSFQFELTEHPAKEFTKNESIIIWGGATVVGLYATQLAKLHGLKVISIASLDHEIYLKELGADIVINRHLSSQEIKSLALAFSTNIKYGIDCVSKDTSTIVLDILSNSTSIKPLFSGIVGLPKQDIPESVEIRQVVIKEFHENIDYGKQFVNITTHFFNNHQIKPVRYRHYQGGLHIIHDALNDLEVLGAKGEKYVVSI
ncbi:chaperonin 10-like protein [Scheffersomyces amazonensis]|uniref:chaperonin 10-like protein n=1 Tax=Scheffersomyces amazonensis TaxID=1078765 RepID=UPI00315D448F